MGTISVTIQETDYIGSRRVVMGTFKLSNSYATGGDAFTPGQFGLEKVDVLSCDDAGISNSTTLAALNIIYPAGTGFTASGGLIQAFGAGTGASGVTQIASTTDLSGYVTTFMAVGW